MKTSQRKNTYLSFKIGKEAFAVSVQNVLEVLEQQNITEVPNVPDYIEGVINFRGKIIPVIDTRIKFNIPKRAEGEKCVIVVFDTRIDEKRMLIGAMADSVHDVIAYDENIILDTPDMGFNFNTDFILGMLKTETSFTMILDIDKVFSTKDLEIIQTATTDISQEV